MHRITGTIEGVAPILFSRMYGSLSGPSPDKTAEQKEVAREQEPHLRCHRDASGVYIPPDMFKQALLAGAKAGEVKKGKKSYATILEATAFCQGPLYLDKDEYDEVFEHWGRVPPGPRGAAVMLRYPKFNAGWRADFDLVLTLGDSNTVVAVRDSLNAAGLLIGMGSWRPEYGRFIVLDWQVSKS